MTLFGLLLLALVTIVPLIDVVNLAWDPIYVYFVGRHWPICVVLSIVGLALVYVCCIAFVYNSSPVDTKIEQIVMVIAVVGVTALGLLFLLISLPMIRESQDAYNDLMHSCENPRTINLCAYYNALLEIRMQPDCLSQTSIEMCPSFQRSEPYTGFLKQLEVRYKCSGFGTGNLTNSTLPASFSPAAGSLIPAAYPTFGKNSLGVKLVSSRKVDGPGNKLKLPKSAPAAFESPEVLLPTSSKETKAGTVPQPLYQATVPSQLDVEHTSAKNATSATGLTALLRRAQFHDTSKEIRPVPIQQAGFYSTISSSTGESSEAVDSGKLTSGGLLTQAIRELANKQQHVERSSSPVEKSTGANGVSLIRIGTVVGVKNMSTSEPGKVGSIPQALFTNVAFTVSCDGMAARDLRYNGMETGKLLYLEGVVLLVIAIVVSLLKFVGMCTGDGFSLENMSLYPDVPRKPMTYHTIM